MSRLWAEGEELMPPPLVCNDMRKYPPFHSWRGWKSSGITGWVWCRWELNVPVECTIQAGVLGRVQQWTDPAGMILLLCALTAKCTWGPLTTPGVRGRETKQGREKWKCSVWPDCDNFGRCFMWWWNCRDLPSLVHGARDSSIIPDDAHNAVVHY